MKFTRDQIAANTVRKIEPGSIVIGDQAYENNIGLTATKLIENWPECPLMQLDAEALRPLLDPPPEMLIVGTGWHAQLPPRELVFELARQGIGIEFMDTPAACRTFNILVSEGREPAAVLYMDE